MTINCEENSGPGVCQIDYIVEYGWDAREVEQVLTNDTYVYSISKESKEMRRVIFESVLIDIASDRSVVFLILYSQSNSTIRLILS